MNEAIVTISNYCSSITVVLAAVALLIKPIREKMLGLKDVKEGQKCLLRSELLRTYYKNKNNESIRQYELENFILCYSAYKKLGGNSFVDLIKKEVSTWEVIS